MGKKQKKGKTQAEKHADFVRVVTPRVRKALKAITLIGNQSGVAYYYTDDDVHSIFGKLHEAVSIVEKRYTSGGIQDVDFSLD